MASECNGASPMPPASGDLLRAQARYGWVSRSSSSLRLE